ncbi:Global transcription regulator sge1-like [Homarus americanus]|uniref:Global transcription regulator sge1-like n=1 Tax=Homarus americanus TaxID=6706 RepID=A0A8J5NCE0_HOMAM|nr:Global transcription regulator sge1-like [Homarus americanus]
MILKAQIGSVSRMLSSRAAAFSVEALLIGGQEHNEEGPHHPLTVEENSIHDPADNDPTTHEPATNEPITLDPATHKPTDHDPDTHKPTAHEPDTHKPTAHDPETHKPTAHDPDTHKPTAHDPDTHKQATHDLVTLDSSAMVQSNDTRGEMSLEESEQSVKGDSQCGSTPPPQHTTLDTHTTQDDNLTHQEAVVQSTQGNTERRASELSTDDDRDTDDEELVVDVESCTTPPPHSPDESSTGVALSSDTPVTPMCHSRCRSPIGLSTQHQFREETFPSASPTGAAEWQVSKDDRFISLITALYRTGASNTYSATSGRPGA